MFKKAEPEQITVKIEGEPIKKFKGWYKGHVGPNKIHAKNWHYYLDTNGTWYHFRKQYIKYVISCPIKKR